MSERKNINWKVESGIGFLEFNNPPGNEMTPDFYHQLEVIVSNIIPDSKVKAIIMVGSGRHFSSGADLDSLLGTIIRDSCENTSGTVSSNPNSLTSNLNTFHFFSKLNIPVIAAIRGVCIGAAMELALCCHFRVCAEGAVLGLPESGYGLIPGIGGIQNLAALTGQAKAIELVLKGSTFSVEQGLKWNVVDCMVSKKELMEVAIRLADLSSVDFRKYLKKDYLRKLEFTN